MIHSDFQSQISTYAVKGRKLAISDRKRIHMRPKAANWRFFESQIITYAATGRN